MKEVTSEFSDAVLVCVGGVPKWLPREDYWSFLVDVIRENNLEGKVILKDRIAHANLPMLYALSKVSVLPSFYEGFPKVVIEAMACSKPVVVTRRSGAEELVDEGKSGFLVDYGSADQLADEIIKVLGDEAMGRRMGEYGRQRVERDFTWDMVASRVGATYDEIFQRADSMRNRPSDRDSTSQHSSASGRGMA